MLRRWETTTAADLGNLLRSTLVTRWLDSCATLPFSAENSTLSSACLYNAIVRKSAHLSHPLLLIAYPPFLAEYYHLPPLKLLLERGGTFVQLTPFPFPCNNIIVSPTLLVWSCWGPCVTLPPGEVSDLFPVCRGTFLSHLLPNVGRSTCWYEECPGSRIWNHLQGMTSCGSKVQLTTCNFNSRPVPNFSILHTREHFCIYACNI